MGLTTKGRDQVVDACAAFTYIAEHPGADVLDVANTIGTGTRYAREIATLLESMLAITERSNKAGTYEAVEGLKASDVANAFGAKIAEAAAAAELKLESNVLRHPCRCGCEANTNHPDSRYLPGHDARHAGAVARALVAENARRPMSAQGIAGFLTAALQTEALVTKAHALFLRWSQAPATSPRKGRKPAVKTGEVKVGRWTYPTRQEGNGPVLRNTRRDGSGEWVTIRSTKQSRATS